MSFFLWMLGAFMIGVIVGIVGGGIACYYLIGLICDGDSGNDNKPASCHS